MLFNQGIKILKILVTIYSEMKVLTKVDQCSYLFALERTFSSFDSLRIIHMHVYICYCFNCIVCMLSNKLFSSLELLSLVVVHFSFEGVKLTL